MTRWLIWDGTASVNRHAAADEIGVVSRSQRTALPTDFFLVNKKTAAGRVGDAGLTFLHKRTAGAG